MFSLCRNRYIEAVVIDNISYAHDMYQESDVYINVVILIVIVYRKYAHMAVSTGPEIGPDRSLRLFSCPCVCGFYCRMECRIEISVNSYITIRDDKQVCNRDRTVNWVVNLEEYTYFKWTNIWVLKMEQYALQIGFLDLLLTSSDVVKIVGR